jgi:hypothetical protein
MMIEFARCNIARVLLAPTAALALACGSTDETAPEDHTPVRFTAAVNGNAMTDTLRLTAGATDTVRFTFYNAADEDLSDHETDHYSNLVFPGAVSATVTAHVGAHFTQVVVNAEGAGTGGMASVEYGHDAQADEFSFPVPFKFE